MAGLPDLWRGSLSSSPFRQMNKLQRNIDRLFDEFMSPFSRLGTEDWQLEGSSFAPPCDIEENATQYLMSFDLPGVKKDDIKIELVDNQLVVTGERKTERDENKEGRVRRERYYGSFQRVFTLPLAGDASKIEAGFQDGVLRVVIPKTAASKHQTIKISEGNLKKTEKVA